jgi:LacI family transcriptional regulator
MVMLEKQQHTRRKPLTSADVARKAGVSRATVSYVLNGVSHQHVSEATRTKVLQAAQELGYHTHPSAQALRRGHSNEICILSSVFFTANGAEIYASIQQQALLHGYVPVIYTIGGLSPEMHRDLLLKIFARRPAALFLTLEHITPEDIALAQRMGIKHIVLGTTDADEEAFPTQLPTFRIPIRSIGYLAARHLLERGHRHLGVVCPDDPTHNQPFQQRLAGMHAAIVEAEGVKIDVLPMQLSLSSAHELVEHYLTGSEHPTGIYAFNDEYALPLLGVLADRGMRIPQDIAVLGTDNVSFSAFIRPALTTISYGSELTGQRIIEVLLTLLNDTPLSEALTRPSTPRLILREST